MEKWKQIAGFEKYEVSNAGRIRSIAGGGYFLTGSYDKGGRRRICLTDSNDKRTTLMMHRLVAQAFLKNPNNLTIVKHRDGDYDNNEVSNLYWIRKTN